MNINHLLNTNPQIPGVVFSQSALKAEESTVARRTADIFTFSDEASRLISQDKKINDNTEASIFGADKQNQTFGEKEPLTDKELSANKESSTSEKESSTVEKEPSATSQESSALSQELSESELQEVEELQRRDTEVRAHEQAHSAAAGNLTQGGASFDYETGPDGKRYAVGGEVSIDTSVVAGDPQATLRKAQQIRRAATAPVDPSAQDRSVAAQASRIEAQARSEISQLGREKQNDYIDENTPEIDFLSPQRTQSEQNRQNTYAQIQNAGVLQEQKSFVDFFI